MKLAHVRLVTDDVPRLVRFYRDVIGLRPAVLFPHYAEFPAGDSMLAISSQETMDAHGAGATRPASNRSTILDFEVEDVDAERLRLDRLVDEFVLEPIDQPWGNRSMLFRDPDGNLINLFAPIRSRDPRGTSGGKIIGQENVR